MSMVEMETARQGSQGIQPGERLAVTIPEAAASLGIGRSTVKELIRTGKLPSVLIFGCRRIPVDALRALAEKGTE